MNKLVLTMFLCAPIAIVAGLWFAIPKDGGRRLDAMNATKALSSGGAVSSGVTKSKADAKDATPEEATEAVKAAMDKAKDKGQKAVEKAADKAAEKASGVQGDWLDRAKGQGAGMLRPEFLPQGYIMVVEDGAKLAAADSPIYLASSYNGWNPGDERFKLTSRSDLRWQMVMKPGKTDAPIAFKFTRGSWDYEELSEDLKPIDNRSLPEVPLAQYGDGKTQPIFEFKVLKWGDQRPNPAARPDINPYYAVEAKNVVRLEVAGGPVTPFKRDVLVWLPPGYDKPENAAKSYPVLYMHDGQNLFQKHSAVPAEWQADETASKLIESGKVAPMIIVGIPHMGGQARYTEYAPFPAKRLENITPKGDDYVNLIIGEVMPRVERQFRVKTGPENTVIGGSSMGAIISLHAAMKHPDKFGSVLLESIAPLGEDNPTRDFFERSRGTLPKRVFFGMGTLEGAPQTPADPLNARYESAMRAIAKLLDGKTEIKLVVGQTPHNEEAWAGRFGGALEYLFPPSK